MKDDFCKHSRAEICGAGEWQHKPSRSGRDEYLPPEIQDHEFEAHVKPRPFVDVLFQGQDESGLVFVECEDGNGNSINAGEWRTQDEFRVLRITL